VVADARAPRDGAFIDVIGHYNPLTNPETIVIDGEKALSWLKQGAQPTAIAARLLSKAGITQKAKPAKAGVTKKPKPAKAAITEEPEPAKAAVTEKPKTTTKKAKPTTEEPKPTKKSKTTKEQT
jgi:small subunit ribosomal protein S16